MTRCFYAIKWTPHGPAWYAGARFGTYYKFSTLVERDTWVGTAPLLRSAIRDDDPDLLDLIFRSGDSAILTLDDARLNVATERLRKLRPRATASDFETLVEVAEKVADSTATTNVLRAELGLDDFEE